MMVTYAIALRLRTAENLKQLSEIVGVDCVVKRGNQLLDLLTDLMKKYPTNSSQTPQIPLTDGGIDVVKATFDEEITS